MRVILAVMVITLIALAGCSQPTQVEEEISIIDRIYLNDPLRAQIGKNVAGFTFSDAVSGERVEIESLRDKPLVVESFYVGCPSCLEGIKEYNKLYDAYDGEIEIMYIDIIEEDSAEYILSIKEQQGGRDWIWVPYDDEVARFLAEYDVQGPDVTFIVDTKGKITYGDSMVAPMKRVEDALKEVLV